MTGPVHFKTSRDVLNIYQNGKLLVSIDRRLAPALLRELAQLITHEEGI